MSDFSIPVTVLIQSTRVDDNPWVDVRWQALGVFLASESTDRLHQHSYQTGEDGAVIYTYTGFSLEFEQDELDSYYQNLISENASVFVVCRADESEVPVPFLTTLSYDEAAVYMETDELVYPVEMGAEIYERIESFVMAHYQPQPLKKRKLVAGSAGAHYQEKGSCE